MPWKTITLADLGLTPLETTRLQGIQGAADIGLKKIALVVGELIGSIRAGGYDAVDDGTIPDIGRAHVAARARWLWLCEFPQLKSMQTDARSKLNDAALEFFKLVSNGKMNIESPFGAAPVAAARSGSAPRLYGRMEDCP